MKTTANCVVKQCCQDGFLTELDLQLWGGRVPVLLLFWEHFTGLQKHHSPVWMILCRSRLPILLKIRPQISHGWMYLWAEQNFVFIYHNNSKNQTFRTITATLKDLTAAALPVLLLHCRVGQLLSVDDQMSVVCGLQCKVTVTYGAAVALLLVLLCDVLQVFFAFCKRHLADRNKRLYLVLYSDTL